MAGERLDSILDGNLKITFWRNEGKNGPYVSADLAKVYQDKEGNLKDGRSLTVSDLARAAMLIDKEAYEKGRGYEQDVRNERQATRDAEYDRGRDQRSKAQHAEAQAERDALKAEQDAERTQQTSPEHDPDREAYLGQRAAESGLQRTPTQERQATSERAPAPSQQPER